MIFKYFSNKNYYFLCGRKVIFRLPIIQREKNTEKRGDKIGINHNKIRRIIKNIFKNMHT